MTIPLPDLRSTWRLGQALAQAIATHGPLPILLSGPLGAGKTTLVRALVEHLPGGDQAEVASPSFNLMNRYPTLPETVHVDLYRETGAALGEELEDVLADPQVLCIVEWAERLPVGVVPSLRLNLNFQGSGRLLHWSAQGDRGQAVAQTLAAVLGVATP